MSHRIVRVPRVDHQYLEQMFVAGREQPAIERARQWLIGMYDILAETNELSLYRAVIGDVLRWTQRTGEEYVLRQGVLLCRRLQDNAVNGAARTYHDREMLFRAQLGEQDIAEGYFCDRINACNDSPTCELLEAQLAYVTRLKGETTTVSKHNQSSYLSTSH